MTTKTIWKYNVGADEFSIQMPIGAQVLDVQLQNGLAQMWALVDPTAEMTTRQFATYGTGHPINADDHTELNYVGTFQCGILVFHLFEVHPNRGGDSKRILEGRP